MDVFLKLIANVLIVFVIAFQVVKQLDALAMLEAVSYTHLRAHETA